MANSAVCAGGHLILSPLLAGCRHYVAARAIGPKVERAGPAQFRPTSLPSADHASDNAFGSGLAFRLQRKSLAVSVSTGPYGGGTGGLHEVHAFWSCRPCDALRRRSNARHDPLGTPSPGPRFLLLHDGHEFRGDAQAFLHSQGALPTIRLNARLNAASEPYPSSRPTVAIGSSVSRSRVAATCMRQRAR